MADRLAEYQAAAASPPAYIKRWHLHGAGLESLEEATVELPKFGSEELLVRHDAVGICFSDIKIVTQGPNHVRLQGRDMQNHPVVMGHEVALTIVGVGERLQGQFTVGQRFIVQADVYYKGENPCYGYQLDGGMAQYGVVTKEVLQGDEGVYLLPLQENTGYVEAALVEPWACVVASYEYPNYRDGILNGGRLLVVQSQQGQEERALPIGPGHQPASVTRVSDPAQTDWSALRTEATGGAGYDDILVFGTPDAVTLSGLMTCLGKRGILNLIWDQPLPNPALVDVGRVHYEQHLFIGTNDPTQVGAAYLQNRRQDLKPGGAAWFVGSGGPMGQMHIQRAIMAEAPPAVIVVSDRHDERLDRTRERFSALAAARGIALHLYNVNTGGDPTAHGPFDDIVSMVPSSELIAETLPFLAEEGVYNIFAGLSRGTLAPVDLGMLLAKRQRIVGTSGSSLADLRHTLELVESGALSTNSSLAAIGGLDAFRDGLLAVKEGQFPGKTVIFPHLPDLPLLSTEQLREKLPSVAAKMQDGLFWTKAAEEELLRETLPCG